MTLLVKIVGLRRSVLLFQSSSWEVRKPQCFQWIKERFNGPNVHCCVHGDGWEECEGVQAMRWPFVKIYMHPGGDHRFPGLPVRTPGYYFAVVYGDPGTENNEDDSWCNLKCVIWAVLDIYLYSLRIEMWKSYTVTI
jgi:hypothetical protein